MQLTASACVCGWSRCPMVPAYTALPYENQVALAKLMGKSCSTKCYSIWLVCLADKIRRNSSNLQEMKTIKQHVVNVSRCDWHVFLFALQVIGPVALFYLMILWKFWLWFLSGFTCTPVLLTSPPGLNAEMEFVQLLVQAAGLLNYKLTFKFTWDDPLVLIWVLHLLHRCSRTS